MTVFKKKCVLPSEKVCLRLKNLRLSKNISLEEIEKCTKINKKYLIAIESCNFSEINLSTIYQKNFIKKYLFCLKEDPKEYLKQFEEEEIQNLKKENYNIIKCKKHDFSNIPSLLRYIIIFLLVFIFGFYIWTHINNILKPPKLVIISPQDGMITEENQININGTTEKETKITINEESIKINKKGFFNQNIILSSGINTIIISAESKHGKKTIETINIILKNRD
jgi:cytoskeletal protein RodZ